MTQKPNQALTVETFKHDDATRKNISTAEYQSVMQYRTMLIFPGSQAAIWFVKNPGVSPQNSSRVMIRLPETPSIV